MILASETPLPILVVGAAQEAPGMPSTIAEVDKLFAAGAESVSLTRAEWEAIQTISKG